MSRWYQMHYSNGTPDGEIASEARLAAEIGGYQQDEGSPALDELQLLLIDHGQRAGWVFQLPGGSDDLFAFAAHITALGQQLAVEDGDEPGELVVLLADYGNGEAWVVSTGEDGLRSFADSLSNRADDMARAARAGSHAGWCACGQELHWDADGAEYSHPGWEQHA